MSYKWCVVPACTNTTIKTPEKLFVCLPKNLKMRKKWLRLASKSTGLSSNSDLFFCEDHLDMDNDMANYDQYKIGLSDMAYGVLLSKFNCQQGSQEIPPTANMQEYVISKPHVATDMNAKVCCAVPQCVNTSQRTANKLFVRVRPKKTIRDKWFNLARRDPTAVGLNSSMSFCEDHFDLPNDMENFMEYHVMGFVAQVRMKPGCIPTKFECQSDRRKPTSNSTERPYYTKETTVKKQRKIFIEECQYDLEERSTKLLELGESLSGSSEAFENRPIPADATISRIIKRFEKCGCVSDCKKCLSLDIPPGQPNMCGDREVRKTNRGRGRKSAAGRGSKTATDQRIKKNQHTPKSQNVAIQSKTTCNSLHHMENYETNYDSKAVKTEYGEGYLTFCDCQSEMLDTVENVQLNSTVKTEDDYEAQEINIEDIKIQHQHCDGHQQNVEKEMCRVKSESDNFSDMIIQNSEYKIEGPCLAEIGDFSGAFQPERLDNDKNIKLFSTIKTEGNDEIQEVKIEDIKIDHQYIDEKPQIH